MKQVGRISLAKGTVVAVLLVAGSTMSACSLLAPEPATPEAAASCNGQPDWCLTVANEVARDTSVYLDGEKAATAPAEGSVRIPVPAGQTRMVNFCKEVPVSQELFGLISSKKILCSKPEPILFDKNQTKIVYDNNNLPN